MRFGCSMHIANSIQDAGQDVICGLEHLKKLSASSWAPVPEFCASIASLFFSIESVFVWYGRKQHIKA